MGGTHRVKFNMKYKKSFYLDCFGGPRDKLLTQQLPKPITFHYCTIQDIDTNYVVLFVYTLSL